MKTFITTLLVFSVCIICRGQAPLVKQWDYRYGGDSEDALTAAQQTIDEGYILGGHSGSDSTGDKTQRRWALNSDYWIVKIDSLGSKQWDKRFGGTGTEYMYALQQTTDKGYILGGWSGSGITGDKTQVNLGNYDYWIVKTDSQGNKQWDKTFGGNDEERLYSLQQTTDKGYILGGWSATGINGDKTQAAWDSSANNIYRGDYWVVKIDSAGNKQWDKRFGGINAERLTCVQQTREGGYILGGYSHSGISGDKTQPIWDTLINGYDYWIVKIDALGNKQWDKRFGGIGYDLLGAVKQTADKGYILAGISSSGIGGDKTQPNWDTTLHSADVWLVKIDSLGSKQWDRRFGGTFYEEWEGHLSITADEGYLIATTSYSPADGDKSEANPPFPATEQGWILKIDPCGNLQWEKTIFTAGHDEGCFGMQTKDGYAIAVSESGRIGGYRTQDNWDTIPSWLGIFTADYWIVKFSDTAQQHNVTSITLTASQTVFCLGDSALVCAPSGYSTYLWNTGESTACIKARLAGNYYVTVSSVNGCTAQSNHLAITVLPLPPISISVNGDTLTVFDALTQQWYLNGSAINGATAPLYIANQSGSYTVAVTDTNGCVGTSSAVIISGVDNLSEEDVVSVYQLTVDGWQLTVGDNWLGGKAEVFNANGRFVFGSKLETRNSKLEINAARGVYLLRVSSAKSSVVRKLVRM